MLAAAEGPPAGAVLLAAAEGTPAAAVLLAAAEGKPAAAVLLTAAAGTPAAAVLLHGVADAAVEVLFVLDVWPLQRLIFFCGGGEQLPFLKHFYFNEDRLVKGNTKKGGFKKEIGSKEQ